MKTLKTIKLMWHLVMYRPWVYLINILLWLAIELSPLLPGLIVKGILDGFTQNRGLDQRFLWLLAAIIGAYILRIILVTGGTYTYILFGFSNCGLLRQNLLKRILDRPGAQALPLPPGEILNRFRDDVQVVDDIFSWFVDALGKLACASFAVVILLTVNARMTVVVFLPLFVVLALVQQVRKRVRKYRENSREATSRVIGSLGEMFSSVQAIQVAGAEEHVINHFQKLNQHRHSSMLQETLFVKILESAFTNVVHLGTGMILLMSAQGMRAGTFSIGDFALFTAYWYWVADFTNVFGGFMSAFQQTRVSTQRLVDLLEGQPASELVKHDALYLNGDQQADDAEKLLVKTEFEPLESLEVRELSYAFAEGERGIRDVSFTVKEGSFTVITGQIGSGKSTLLRVLLGLLPIDDGEVLWNGQVVTDPASFFVPPRAAYTGQVPHLLSDSVRNNILLGQLAEQQDLHQAIYGAVLEQDLANFEQGLDTLVGPRGMKLSGGQIQRVAAARMFASQAQLYLFDDISSALDVETESLLWDRLFAERKQTCIAVSNRRLALQRADQIIVLKEGRVVAKGRLEELLPMSEELRQIFDGSVVENRLGDAEVSA